MTKQADLVVLGGSLEGRICAAEAAERGEKVILVEPSEPSRRVAFEAALRASILPAAAIGRIGWAQVREAILVQEARLRDLGEHLLQLPNVTVLVGKARFLQPELGEPQPVGRVSLGIDSDAGCQRGNPIHCVSKRVQVAVGVPGARPCLRVGMTDCRFPEELPDILGDDADVRVAVLGDGGRAAEICALCEAASAKVVWFLEGDAPQLEVAGELGGTLVSAMQLRGLEVLRNFAVWRVQKERDGRYTLLSATGCTPMSGFHCAVYVVDAHQLVPPAVPSGTRWRMLADARRGYVFLPLSDEDEVFDDLRLPPIRADMIWSRPPLGTAGFSIAEAWQAYGTRPHVVLTRHQVCGGPELSISSIYVGCGAEARCVGASVLGSGAATAVLGLSVALQAGATRASVDTVLATFPAWPGLA